MINALAPTSERESIYLHPSGPLLESGPDRPENRNGRCCRASSSSICMSTAGVEGPEFPSEGPLSHWIPPESVLAESNVVAVRAVNL